MKGLAYRIPQIFLGSVLAIGLCLSSPVIASQNNAGMNTIYGWHLMSQYEREHFRYLLTLQNSPEDRENFLLLHKHKMQYRAAQLTHPEPKPSIQQNLRSVSLSGRIRR